MKEVNFRIKFLIKTCPWCDKTPELDLHLNDVYEDSCAWKLLCVNELCLIRPRTKHKIIKKTGKYNILKQIKTVENLILMWNINNSNEIKDETFVDFKINLNRFQYYWENCRDFRSKNKDLILYMDLGNKNDD
ncbi:MAG: hypothetical protein ACE5RC_00015 [Nitrosopumilus sp.]